LLVSLFLADSDSLTFLADELRRSAPEAAQTEIVGLGIAAEVKLDGLWLAFARQTLPDAVEVSAASINAWADRIIDAVAGHFPDDQPWRLHLWPHYGEGRAGLNRCELIRASVIERLKKKRRHLLRSFVDAESSASRTSPHPNPLPQGARESEFLPRPAGGERAGVRGCSDSSPAPFTPQTSLVQCILTSPEAGWLSTSLAPLPHTHRQLISSFPRGEVPLADDKSAPSRAFTKLVESEQRLGRRIERGQTCVDLGASPGSWSYVAIQRGAHVIAVDRSELREDLMRSPRLRFEAADAFKYQPPQTVDWLVCDVIAAPQRSIDLLLEWLRGKRMRNFVVTLKFKGHDEYPLLETLKRDAPPLCAEFHLTRLCANKNEVCAFGIV
jgi:23S rRNA (cytidine2498-2'-O)-methyltransferase